MGLFRKYSQKLIVPIYLIFCKPKKLPDVFKFFVQSCLLDVYLSFSVHLGKRYMVEELNI